MLPNTCCPGEKFLYSLHAEDVSGGCDTCGYGASADIRIARYCGGCRSQQGNVTLIDNGVREFDSFDEIFTEMT